MQRTLDPTSILELAARYSVTQRRTLNVAHALFAQHGVGGTSLQMIAETLGVTKAAVYHQFQTKDAIVRAVIEVQLESTTMLSASMRGSASSPRRSTPVGSTDV